MHVNPLKINYPASILPRTAPHGFDLCARRSYPGIALFAILRRERKHAVGCRLTIEKLPTHGRRYRGVSVARIASA